MPESQVLQSFVKSRISETCAGFSAQKLLMSNETSKMADRVAQVALAIVWRRGKAGVELLITRRPGDVHLGGLWEFAGGKVEPCEEVAVAAARELREETGIDVPAHRFSFLCKVEHAYPGRKIAIHAHLVEIAGDPAVQGAGIVDHRWISLDELSTVEFPEANRSVIEQIRGKLKVVN